MRQGGDPRLPLELALVKVTRPAADLSRESLAFRIERLEEGHSAPRETLGTASATVDPEPKLDPPVAPLRVELELEQLQEAWRRTILPAVEQRSIPIGQTLGEAHPAALAGDTLTLEFPPTAAFHLSIAEDPKNATMLREALYEVTGRKLAVTFELGEKGSAVKEDDTPTSEADVLELVKNTFDARELDQ
jgi:DNA polymerase III subunit tau-like protein